MLKRSILIIEDEDIQREAIAGALRNRGFDVLDAKTVAEAEQWIGARSSSIDVAICDMRLEDPCSKKTGADLAELLAGQTCHFPAEILFFTAYNDMEFFQAALRVQAAEYLRKATTKLHQLIQHVRVLSLRRALADRSRDFQRRTDSIARRTGSLDSALEVLFRELWAPAIEEHLDMHAGVVMIKGKDPKAARSCGGSIQISPSAVSVLVNFWRATGVENDRERVLPIHEATWNRCAPSGAAPLPRELAGATWAPLLLAGPYAVFVVLKPRENAETALPETLNGLPALLERYLRQTGPSHLVHLSTAVQNANHLRSALHLSARMCYVVSHRQSDILQASKDAGAAQGRPLRMLEELQCDLRDAGDRLGDLENDAPSETAASSADGGSLDGAALVWRSWDRVQKPAFAGGAVAVQGTCRVAGRERDYCEAFSTLLQWMSSRLRPGEEERDRPVIQVDCKETDDSSIIVFKDRSGRLPARWRDKIFEPFGAIVQYPASEEHPEGTRSHLSLFVARLIIELRLRGHVQDDTEGLGPSSSGYSFQLRFPRPPGAARSDHTCGEAQ